MFTFLIKMHFSSKTEFIFIFKFDLTFSRRSNVVRYGENKYHNETLKIHNGLCNKSYFQHHRNCASSFLFCCFYFSSNLFSLWDGKRERALLINCNSNEKVNIVWWMPFKIHRSFGPNTVKYCVLQKW